MDSKTLRRLFQVLLVLATILLAFLLSACGVTEYQRFADRADAARADLNSPSMTARICALGADTSEYRSK